MPTTHPWPNWIRHQSTKLGITGSNPVGCAIPRTTRSSTTGDQSIESSDKNKKSWYTVGVSENIIEASFRALIDSVEYKLLKEKVAPVKSN